MLQERILQTIHFFDLQEYPLTAFEVHQYLVSHKEIIKTELDEHYELQTVPNLVKPIPVHFDTVLQQLGELVANGKLEQSNGLYALNGHLSFVAQRLQNYKFGIFRERRVRRYLRFARHIPFVRGVALGGSQAMGLQRSTSDIDLFIITDPRYMWLARVLLSMYFQVLGMRRHGKKIANRFCLNHYIANSREVDAERNLYKAMEYKRLRPVVYPQSIVAFQDANIEWIKMFFPNTNFEHKVVESQSRVQFVLEKILNNSLGKFLEKKLGNMQLRRIKQDTFTFVKDDELSFHPESKHEVLLKGFFEK